MVSVFDGGGSFNIYVGKKLRENANLEPQSTDRFDILA